MGCSRRNRTKSSCSHLHQSHRFPSCLLPLQLSRPRTSLHVMHHHRIMLLHHQHHRHPFPSPSVLLALVPSFPLVEAPSPPTAILKSTSSFLNSRKLRPIPTPSLSPSVFPAVTPMASKSATVFSPNRQSHKHATRNRSFRTFPSSASSSLPFPIVSTAHPSLSTLTTLNPSSPHHPNSPSLSPVFHITSSPTNVPRQVVTISPRSKTHPTSVLIHPSPAYPFNIRLKQYARSKHGLPTCLSILHQMRRANVRPDKYTYSLLLTSCIRSKAHNTAIQVYHQIRKDSVPLDHHLRTSLLKIAASSPHPKLDLCLRLFRGATRPNRHMCNVMMDAYASVASVRNCLSTYRYMLSANIVPDAYTVSAIVKAYIRANRLHDALNSVRELHKAGIAVPPAAFAQLIHAFGKNGQLDHAVQVYDIMTAWHIQPTQVIFNVLIGACVHAADTIRAVEIFEEMKHTANLPGDRYTFHALIDCYLKKGDGHTALHWYRRITQSPFQKNQVSYRLALIAAAQAFDIDAVYEVVDDMEAGGAQPRQDTTAHLVASCIRCSDLQGATTFFRRYATSLSSHKDVTIFLDDIRLALRAFEDHVAVGLTAHNPADYEQTAAVVDELHRCWFNGSHQY